MSIASTPSMSRALGAARLDATDAPSGEAALPPVIRDAQGREFRLQVDAASGLPQYRHASEQRDQAGSSLSLEVLITLAADGSFTRRTTQHLQLASGDSQREEVLASFGTDGAQVGETVDSFTRRGTQTTTERTTGTYAQGELVRRETTSGQRDEATDAAGEHAVVSADIRGTWFNGGAPLTDDVVPMVDRTETQQITTPGQGLHKQSPRTLTFTAHGAGPLNALTWDDSGKLVVRFEGAKGQYLERELRVPLDRATGTPDMERAEVVRTDDGQNLVNKGLMQARIWGGLVSNLSWVVGLNFARGSLGKGFLALSAAAAGAQLTGEVHAVATRRNDGDWGRVATSAYDVLLTGMLAAYMTGRPDARTSLGATQRLGLTGLAGAGAATNVAELGALRSPSTAAGFTPVELPDPAPSPLDGAWRSEPRFDAAAALLG
jgi:hypothetical protein